jgi:hypothetical protein
MYVDFLHLVIIGGPTRFLNMWKYKSGIFFFFVHQMFSSERQSLSRSYLRKNEHLYINLTDARAWSANFKMVWYVLLRPLRPELGL